MFGVEVDNAIGVLHDGAGSRACGEAARVGTVHAVVLADQPLQIALLIFELVETHHLPGVGGEVKRVVVHSDALADLVTQVIPFGTGNLARFATDAACHIDQLGDTLHIATTCLWRRDLGRRAGDDVLLVNLRTSHRIRLLPLQLVDTHQERLEFRCLGVGITDGWRQCVGQVGLACLTQEPPVQRNADLMNRLAGHL